MKQARRSEKKVDCSKVFLLVLTVITTSSLNEAFTPGGIPQVLHAGTSGPNRCGMSRASFSEEPCEYNELKLTQSAINRNTGVLLRIVLLAGLHLEVNGNRTRNNIP